MARREPLAILDDDERALAAPAPAPERATLMKAVLERSAFSDAGWLFERKLDGVRCLAIADAGAVRMLSRNDHDLTGRYPEVHEALAQRTGMRAAIDGEVVAFERGRTSFAALADRGHHPRPVFLYAFDVLWVDDHDVRALPLRARKRVLRAALAPGGALHLTPHRNADGEALFSHACRHGWEGVIAKRADSPYRAARSRDWLKIKCEAGQELVIGGFTAPRGSRAEFGALLVGYHEGGALRYAGKVGTGFDGETLRSLGERMRALEVARAPFADPGAIRERDVTWIAPRLVAQVAFTEWTNAGRLRHPRFEGLRDDKSADEVVREA